MFLGRARVFFDVHIGKQQMGRIALELVSRIVAKSQTLVVVVVVGVVSGGGDYRPG